MRAQPSDALKQQGRGGGTAAHGRLGHGAGGRAGGPVAGAARRRRALRSHVHDARPPRPRLRRRAGAHGAHRPGLDADDGQRARRGRPGVHRGGDAACRACAAPRSRTPVPLSGNNWNNRVDLAAGPPRPRRAAHLVQPASRPAGSPPTARRSSTAATSPTADTAAAVPAAIVNEAFARAFTGGREPGRASRSASRAKAARRWCVASSAGSRTRSTNRCASPRRRRSTCRTRRSRRVPADAIAQRAGRPARAPGSVARPAGGRARRRRPRRQRHLPPPRRARRRSADA